MNSLSDVGDSPRGRPASSSQTCPSMTVLGARSAAPAPRACLRMPTTSRGRAPTLRSKRYVSRLRSRQLSRESTGTRRYMPSTSTSKRSVCSGGLGRGANLYRGSTNRTSLGRGRAYFKSGKAMPQSNTRASNQASPGVRTCLRRVRRLPNLCGGGRGAGVGSLRLS